MDDMQREKSFVKEDREERYIIKNREVSREKLLNKERELRRKKERAIKRRKLRKVIIVAIIALVICEAFIILFMNPGKNSSTVPEKPNTSDETETINEKDREIGYKPEERNYPSVSYYKEENADRYVKYAEKNPEMEDEDIVWRVNANLDKKGYEVEFVVSDKNNTHMLVNKYNKVPDDYKPDDLVVIDKFFMRKETGDAYINMRDAALADGYKLTIVSAYRTVPYQNGLYNNYLKKDPQENVDAYCARAGYSEHHTGMAIDLFGTREDFNKIVDMPEYKWVKENCHKYGFIIRYPEGAESITGYEYKPWHIRYVGVDVSSDMRNRNIKTFEEYHAKYLAN